MNNLMDKKEQGMSILSNAIKVPMIILVIFVHENLNLERDGFLGVFLASIAYVAVPTFFLISGYYFFHGKELNVKTYVEKLKKRSKTLLLPCLIWNLLPMLNIVVGNIFSVVFRGKSTEALQTYFAGLWDNGMWHVWWDITAGTMPYDSPLWYVRDLMVMCVLSPLAYFFIKYTARYGAWTLVIFYVLGVNTGIVGLNMAAITFFMLGGHFSLSNRKGYTPNLFAYRYRWVLVPTMLVSLLLRVALVEWEYSGIFQMLYIVSGVFVSYYLVGIMDIKWIEKMCVLSASVFFIYALHNTCILAWCGSLAHHLALPHSLEIVIVPFAAFAVCYAIYSLIKKVCPRILAVLCGGRI